MARIQNLKGPIGEELNLNFNEDSDVYYVLQKTRIFTQTALNLLPMSRFFHVLGLYLLTN